MSIEVVQTIAEVRSRVSMHKSRGDKVGFVPTMGALHPGHTSLISAASEHDDFVVVSVFVNPTQFNDISDLDAYPRVLDADVSLAEDAGAHLVFAPSVDEMYPSGMATTVSAGELATVLEGHFRPGHFDGVATICTKLFCIVNPDHAFFGEKDAQQLAVVRRVVTDLDLTVEIVGCPTVREPDGLAMSSRNVHLSASERLASRSISQALFEASEQIKSGGLTVHAIETQIRDTISASGLTVQYASVVDPASFTPPRELDGEVIVAVAAFASKTRLIDNVRADGTRKGLN